MAAMYGEDAGGDAGSSFEVCNSDVASALTAMVDAWEASGDAAAAAVISMDALPPLHVSLTIAVPSSDDGGASGALPGSRPLIQGTVGGIQEAVGQLVLLA